VDVCSGYDPSLTVMTNGLTLTAKLVLGILAGATWNMPEGDIKVDMGVVHTVLRLGAYTTREPDVYFDVVHHPTSEIHTTSSQSAHPACAMKSPNFM